MKVAITLCVFAVAISSAFAEESSNESLQVRVARYVSSGHGDRSRDTRKKQKKSKGRVNKYKKAQEKKRRLRKNKNENKKLEKRVHKTNSKSKGTKDRSKRRKKKQKKKIRKNERKKNRSDKKKQKKNVGETKNKSKETKKMRKKMKKKNKRIEKNEYEKVRGKKGRGRGKHRGMRKKVGKQVGKNNRGFRQSCNLTSDDVSSFKKIRNFISQEKRLNKTLQLIQKKANTTTFAEAAETLGEVTNNGTGTDMDANSAYILLNNCSISMKKFCSTENLILNAPKCLEQFPTFEAYMECQKTKPLNECEAPATFAKDCKKITDTSKEAKKRKSECLDPDTVGSFAYCMKFIKTGLLDSVPLCQLTTTTTTTAATSSTTQPPSISLENCPICPIPGPSRLWCPDEPTTTKANNYRNQADAIRTIYNLLSEKLDLLNVFTKYSFALGKLTANGTRGTALAKNAYNFLTACKTTARVSCDNTEFDSLLPRAEECWEEVNCTNIPENCKLQTEREAVADRRNSCLGEGSGSFLSCNNFVKENISSIILLCDDLPEELPKTDRKTIRTEETEVIIEESSFDPNTKELTISVPSHGNREAATFIIGEIVTCIVYPQECLVSDTTKNDQDLLNGAENTGNGNTDIVELKETDLENSYSFSIVVRVLSAEEIAQLPQSIQDASKGKTVRRATSIVVDEETFKNTDTFIDGSDFNGCNPTTTQSPGCANKNVSTTYKPRCSYLILSF